jgi:hypothetical protein
MYDSKSRDRVPVAGPSQCRLCVGATANRGIDDGDADYPAFERALSRRRICGGSTQPLLKNP